LPHELIIGHKLKPPPLSGSGAAV